MWVLKMPTKDSVVRTARLRAEVMQKMEEFMEREDLTYSAAVSRLIEEMDMPKQRKEYVNTERFVEVCERTNRNPQQLIDQLTERLIKGR